jgi:hypothetical protein
VVDCAQLREKKEGNKPFVTALGVIPTPRTGSRTAKLAVNATAAVCWYL